MKAQLEEPGLILDEISEQDSKLLENVVKRSVARVLRALANEDTSFRFNIYGLYAHSFATGVSWTVPWKTLLSESIGDKDQDYMVECVPVIVTQLRNLADKMERRVPK